MAFATCGFSVAREKENAQRVGNLLSFLLKKQNAISVVLVKNSNETLGSISAGIVLSGEKKDALFEVVITVEEPQE